MSDKNSKDVITVITEVAGAESMGIDYDAQTIDADNSDGNNTSEKN